MNDRFLRALRREPVDCTPVWFMRQAGRYLPEYRALRAKAGNFLNLCQTPELACAVTLQPIDRYDLDAAIIFSDILVILEALGLDLNFVEGEGPQFSNPIRELSAIAALLSTEAAIDDLHYVGETVRLSKIGLAGRVPLIGFAGSPWTVATYAVEGRGGQQFAQIKAMMLDAPDVLHMLLQKITHATIEYLSMQINAGVDVIMLFDTWGNILSDRAYQSFSLAYTQTIFSELEKRHPTIPRILFTKSGLNWLSLQATSGATALGLDWTGNLQSARQQVGSKLALQGNLDPAVLRASPEVITQQVSEILASYGKGSGHIFNLGHGLTPDLSPEKVGLCIDAVHRLSVPYHE